MVYKRFYRVGDQVTVKAINPPCYRLPEGLPAGATVKVLSKGIGYDAVEYDGKIFKVSMVLIDSGWQTVPDSACA